jgi:hypothetical protein
MLVRKGNVQQSFVPGSHTIISLDIIGPIKHKYITNAPRINTNLTMCDREFVEVVG